MKEISDILKKGVEDGHFPGAGYAIIYQDGRVDYDYVGYKQLYPDKILNNGQEIYDCASLTKVISTTTMIMKLIEEGKLTLETKISSVLPRFKHHEITIYHLMTHSSGLPADISRAKELKDKNEVLNRIFEYDLIYNTGEKVVYSDIGYILLGLIIEKLTNKTLAEYAEIVIFKPLGMNDTSYFPDRERSAPTEYRDDSVFQGWLKGKVHDEKAYALNGLAGHAGMFSTPIDIGKFILSILRNDEKILKKESVNLLFPLRIEDRTNLDNILVRSIGWNKPTKGGTAGDYCNFEQTILHTGFTGCNVWIDRAHEIGFVMLSNAVHPKRSDNRIIRYRNIIGNLILSSKEG
jgi:CubicO group peptidase (beta-lactamase class C family)